MRVTIAASATLLLIAGAITMIKWPSASVELASGAAAMPPLQELHDAVQIEKLPVQEIDDQALIYPSRRNN
jgi:hypothetical protein